MEAWWARCVGWIVPLTMAALTYFAPPCIRHGNSTLTPGTLELSSLTRDLQQILDHFEVRQAGMGRRGLVAVSRNANAQPRAGMCLVKASMAIYRVCFFCCRACQISYATRFDHSIPLSCCQGSVGWPWHWGLFGFAVLCWIYQACSQKAGRLGEKQSNVLSFAKLAPALLYCAKSQ